MPRPRMSPEHFVRACAKERHVKISQEPLYTEIYRRNDGAQNRGRHFVRACAVQMHVQISQEPLYTEIYRKNAVAQNEPRTLSASLRSRNACQDFTRATLYRTLQKKCRRPKPHPTLCQPAQFLLKLTGKMTGPRTAAHALCVRLHKSLFIRKCSGKMPGPRVSTGLYP